MFNHAASMLGPYDDMWWWDHLTHTHSATLLGAFVHVRARRNGCDPQSYVLGVVGCRLFIVLRFREAGVIMNQGEFETQLQQLVYQAPRQNLRIEGCEVRSPQPDMTDYDIEITELSKLL